MSASSKSELDAIALLRKELEAQRLAYEKKLREKDEELREKNEGSSGISVGNGHPHFCKIP